MQVFGASGANFHCGTCELPAGFTSTCVPEKATVNPGVNRDPFRPCPGRRAVGRSSGCQRGGRRHILIAGKHFSQGHAHLTCPINTLSSQVERCSLRMRPPSKPGRQMRSTCILWNSCPIFRREHRSPRWCFAIRSLPDATARSDHCPLNHYKDPNHRSNITTGTGGNSSKKNKPSNPGLLGLSMAPGPTGA